MAQDDPDPARCVIRLWLRGPAEMAVPPLALARFRAGMTRPILRRWRWYLPGRVTVTIIKGDTHVG